MNHHPSHFAGTTPDKPAIIVAETGEQLTFAQLEDISNKGAQLFRKMGLKTGDTVAIMIENGLEYLSVYWAASRCGLYITAISTSLQRSEIEYIIENCEAGAFIASNNLADKVDFSTLNLLVGTQKYMVNGIVDGFLSWEGAVDGMPAQRIADESEGTLMLYSSGTTGRPKGIKQPLEPKPLGSDPGHVMMHQYLFHATADSVYLSVQPLYHAAALYFAQAYSRMGATVIVMKQFVEENVLKTIQQYKVTHSQCVPTMLIRLLKLDPEIRAKYDVSSMQCAVHTAAPCPVEIKTRMIEWWGPVIYEYYSATEGIGMTMLDTEQWLEHKGSVGKAVFGEIHIVDDETGSEVPVGETGTIYFGGGTDFKYHNDEEKTQSTRHVEKDWKTVGDMGYVDEDGYLYLTDRKINMIISGGVNIYPQEVENLIVTHPQVADVAVIGVPNEEFGEEVKAVVQPCNMADATPELERDIIAFCKANISSIKCPRSVDFVEELPRTPVGKLIKRLLVDKYREQYKARQH